RSAMENVRSIFDRRPRTAFVLGGGGNLGSVQVGQLKAMVERNITPDVVIGCSVGSLNGAAIACDPSIDTIHRLEMLWNGLTKNDIFPAHGRTRGPWLFIKQGLSAYGDHGLKDVIGRWLDITSFEDTKLPFWAVATALRTGLEKWFNAGDLTSALMASTALPGFLPPVHIDGEDYVDGGVVNNVPMSKAFELGAKRVYVLDVGLLERERPAPKRPYEVLMQAVSIARAHRYRADSADVPEGVELIKMPVVDPGRMKFDDFSRSAELIDRAYRLTKAFLDRPDVAAAIA
ncbi:MAG: patatin-like phospholipase family protein, partial [Actinomycetota bacterium]